MATGKSYGTWVVRAAAVGAVALTGGMIACKLSASAAEAEEVKYTRNVAVVLYDGVELLDFAGPSEAFASAAGFGSNGAKPAFHVYTVATTRAPLKSQGFVTITPEYSIDDAPAPDIVVIPGGSTQRLQNDEKFMTWAKGAMKSAELTLTVCTGAFVPADAGLLDGLHVTTFYGAIGSLRKQAPKAIVEEGRRFIDNGNIVTTAGVSAGIDGALHVIARLLGRQVADRTARYMEYRWTPEPYLAQGYSYLNPSLDDHGRDVQQASQHEDAKDWPQAEKAYRALLEKYPKDGHLWYRLGFVLQSSGQLDPAIDANKHAAEFADVQADARYNLACAYALKGRADDAIEQLKLSVAAGFKQKGLMESDPDLTSLRSDARFKQIVEGL